MILPCAVMSFQADPQRGVFRPDPDYATVELFLMDPPFSDRS